MGVDNDRMPFELIDKNDDFIGIAPDLINLVSERLDIDFEIYPTEDWNETLKFSKEGKFHLIPFLNKTPAREDWLIFTEPLLVDPNVLITRTEHEYISDLSLLKDKTIVLIEGTMVVEKIKRDFPNLNVITVKSELECFKMVESKKAHMTLRSLIVSAYTIRKEGLFNLKINNKLEGYTNYLRMGVLKSEPLLRDILNKGIATISDREREEIINRHVYIEFVQPYNYFLFIRIFIVLLLITSITIFWVIKIKKVEVKLREAMDRYESLAKQSRTVNWEVDKEGLYTYISSNVEEIWGYSPKELITKEYFYNLCPEKTRDYYKKKGLENIKDKEKISNWENPIMTKGGNILWVLSAGYPILDKNKEAIGYRGVDTDITERINMLNKIKFQSSFQKVVAEVSSDFINVDLYNFEEKLNNMLKQIGVFLEVDRSFIFELSKDKKFMSNTFEWCNGGIDPVKDLVQNYPVKDVPMIGKLIKSRDIFFVSDVNDLGDEFKAEKKELKLQGVKSVLCVPVIKSDSFLGYFGFDSVKKVRFIDEEQIELLRILGNIIGDVFLKNNIVAQLEEKNMLLEKLATVDVLSGLKNRYFFNLRAEEEVERASRYNKKLSLILIDIDHFKRVNDNFGHDVGGQVIKKIAHMLRESIRKSDIVARWGGEEFIILLPEVSLEGAVLAAEKIRVEAMELKHMGDQKITISLGVSEFLIGEKLETWFKKTDEALYRAKKSGRSSAL